MVVTFPTCQEERSSLKATAPLNTAPHNNKEKPKGIKMGLKKKEERALFKNRISACHRKKKGNRSSQKKTRSWRGGKRVYVLACMFVTFPTCHLERSRLKATAL
jgi:hypothetical protein